MLFQCTDTLELSACVQGLKIMIAYCYTLNCKKLLSLTTDFNRDDSCLQRAPALSYHTHFKLKKGPSTLQREQVWLTDIFCDADILTNAAR